MHVKVFIGFNHFIILIVWETLCFLLLFYFNFECTARQIKSALLNMNVSINRFYSEIKRATTNCIRACSTNRCRVCACVLEKTKWNRMPFKTKCWCSDEHLSHPFKTVIWTDIHCHFHNAAIQLFAQSNIMGRNSYEMADATSWTKSWKKDRPQFSELDCYCWKCTHFCE